MNLMADAPSASPSWESHLDRLGNLFKICLATGNHGPMHAFIASDVSGDVDHRSMFYHGPNAPATTMGNDDRLRPLMDVNIGFVSGIRDIYDDRLKQLRCQVDNEPNLDKLEGALRDSIEAMKKHSAEAWDKAVDDSKDIIRKLPQGVRSSAARIFTGALAPSSIITELQVKGLERAIHSLEPCGCLHKFKGALCDALAGNEASVEASIEYIRAIYRIGPKEQLSAEAKTLTGLSIDEIPVDDLGVDRLSLRKTANGWEVCDFSD